MKKKEQKRLCPYLSEHYGGCLSADMQGMTVASVLNHCSAQYEACGIYQKFTGAGPVADYTGPNLNCSASWPGATKEVYVFIAHDHRIFS